MQLPVAAPPGFDQALCSILEWRRVLEPSLEEPLRDLVHRYCGPKEAAAFTDHGEMTARKQLSRIDDILFGSFGPVRPEDRLLIQTLYLSLNSEKMLGPHGF